MEQQRIQNDLPAEITPTLYLGNCQCAHDVQRLQTLNIRRALNMAGPTATPSAVVDAYAANGIAYKVICARKMKRITHCWTNVGKKRMPL